MATTTRTSWQRTIIDELDQLQLTDEIPEDHTHAAVFVPSSDDETALLLGTAESELAAIVIAEDKGAPFADDGEARVVKLADLVAWSRANAAGGKEPQLEGPTVEPRRQNVETEQPDEVEQPSPEVEEPEEDTAAHSLHVDAAGQTAAFDPSQYDREDLQIPKIDGQSIDRIAIKFGGEIHLDRSDPSDVALYNALRFGKDVAMLIEGRCNSTGAKGATDREGDLDVVIGQKSLKIHSISKPAGADWVTEA